MRQLAAALGLALVLSAALPGAADAVTIERMYAVGNEPFGVTIDPSDGRIYVANSDQGSSRPGVLSVVDPVSNSVSAIALASPPTLSALDRGLGRLFVTTANGTLTFVDVATQSVVNAIPNAGGLGVAVDEATHHVYAAALTSLSMVDGTSGTVLHTASAGPGDRWWAVALDMGAHRVYVTNVDPSAPSLVILDADDLSLVGEVPLPDVPRFALAVDSARQRVYVAGYSPAGKLYVVDGGSGQVTMTVDLQAGDSFPFSATLVPSEDRLYLSQLDGPGSPNRGIVGLDLATLQVVERISLMWQPGATALHANGRLYVAGFSANLLAALVRGNSAPSIDRVTVSPLEAKTNDVVTAVVTAHDPEGDPFTLSYQWSVNKVPVAGETAPSFDLSKPGNGDRNDLICLTVTASDGAAESSVFNCFLFVQDSAPAMVVTLDPTSPTTNAILKASASATDADGDAITYTFTWKVNGIFRATVNGATASSFFDLAAADNGDRGQTVLVEVVASDGTLQSSMASASAVVANSAPTVAVSLNNTSPRSNDVLVATASALDADGDPLTLTYTWRVNGVTKQSGPSRRFDLGVKGHGDKRDVITVTVTASDGTASATTSATATVR